MLSKRMKQQEFASAIGISPATLSSIFNERTRPTLSIVDAIKSTFPDISTDWLLFGSGEMLLTSDSPSSADTTPSLFDDTYPELKFEEPHPDIVSQQAASSPNPTDTPAKTEMKIVDKPQRRVVEIKVYYDDYTYESFVPEKK